MIEGNKNYGCEEASATPNEARQRDTQYMTNAGAGISRPFAKSPFPASLTDLDINAAIAGEQYHVFPGTTLTVCALTLQNGYTVVGHSACATPANFDPVIGMRLARENARQQIWALEGYVLRNRLSGRGI